MPVNVKKPVQPRSVLASSVEVGPGGGTEAHRATKAMAGFS